ncbi:MAG: RNA ligase family protein [Propionibacteriaceae bacterium]|nr:RNA ligase family protein [Propionibacteriaceae bacterium]
MDDSWIATEKIDGTSTTFSLDRDGFHVAGHNWAIVENPDNALWQMASKYDVERKLRDWLADSGAQQVAIQGETYGEKIQGNPLRVKGVNFAAFNFIADGRRLPRTQWPEFAVEMSVPVLNLPIPTSVDQALEQADELRSKVNPSAKAEGIVWRSSTASEVVLPDGQHAEASFKVVSNKYLLKHDR